MVLLTMGTTEILILVAIGIILVALIGTGLMHYVKLKMEREMDEVEREVEAEKENRVDEEDDDNIAATEEKTEESLSEIELLLQEMQSDLEKQEQNPVHTFEEEQEEKAVISYQELKAMKEEPKLSNEVAMYEEEQERKATASVSETLSMTQILEDKKESVPPTKPAFSSSEFISPVYGKMEAGEPNYPKIPNFKEEFNISHDTEKLHFDDVEVNLKREQKQSLEDTFKLDPISKETKNSEEFLKALKDFRNNLE